MAADTGRVVMVLLSFGFAAVVPIVGGSLWSVWRTSVEQRQLAGLEQLQADHPPEPEPPPAPPPAPEGPPTPESVFSFVSELQISAQNRADALPDLPFRIALLGEEGQLAAGATVDLGRDGTIDEAWTLRGAPASRELRGPDGSVTRRLVLAGNVWIGEGEQPPEPPPAIPGTAFAPAAPGDAAPNPGVEPAAPTP